MTRRSGIDRRAFLGGVGAAGASAVATGWRSPAVASGVGAGLAPLSDPPNIVLIMTDDLGWFDLGCYGSTFYETPNLDRLAGEGVRFTDAYAAAPVCSPTRAAIMTGKYPASVGITQYLGGAAVGRLTDVPYFAGLPWSEQSIARTLRDGGYATWHVGKWHLGPDASYPERHGFDVNIGGSSNGLPPGGFFSPYGISTLPDGPEGEYLTDRLTDESVDLIESAGSEPFFLHLSHYAPHVPIEAPEALVEKYRRKAADLDLDDIDPFEEGEPFPHWPQRFQNVRRRQLQFDPEYAAMIESIDTNIGRVLDALERTGKADNTLVLFSSDNGGLATAEGSPTFNGPLAEGKGWLYEGGIRVPLLVRWPAQIPAGSVVSEPVPSPDVYPTFLEATGLPRPQRQQLEGTSFLPLLLGDQLERGPIFWHYPHYSNQGGTPAAAVRDGNWKLIHFYEDDRVEFYDLNHDLGENHDLAGSVQHRAKLTRLRRLLKAWQELVDARVPRPNPSPAFPDLPGDSEFDG